MGGVYARLSRGGIKFVARPSKQFWGYGAVLTDPDGHVINLYDEESMKQKG